MDGIERIKILASEVKDKAVLKIINYLLTRNDMNEKYLNEEKSLTQMIQFIKSEAKKEAQDGMAMIEDDVVYGWAIHYWDETNENLNLTKHVIESTKQEVVENTIDDEDDEAETVVPEKKAKSKNWVAEGQLTLFDM